MLKEDEGSEVVGGMQLRAVYSVGIEVGVMEECSFVRWRA
jgi:hypothetical protein